VAYLEWNNCSRFSLMFERIISRESWIFALFLCSDFMFSLFVNSVNYSFCCLVISMCLLCSSRMLQNFSSCFCSFSILEFSRSRIYELELPCESCSIFTRFSIIWTLFCVHFRLLEALTIKTLNMPIMDLSIFIQVAPIRSIMAFFNVGQDFVSDSTDLFWSNFKW